GVPGEVHARGGGEPLSVRLRRRSAPAVRLPAAPPPAVPAEAVRALGGPHRPAPFGAATVSTGAAGGGAGREVRHHPAARRGGPGPPAPPVPGPGRDVQRPGAGSAGASAGEAPARRG